MILHLETTSGVPIYRQVMDQVRGQVAAGRIEVGEQIPSVRQLAKSLAVNPLTISRAYRELERQGIIETRRGIGTFVAKSLRRPKLRKRLAQLGELADRLAMESIRLDVPADKVQDLLRKALNRYQVEARNER